MDSPTNPFFSGRPTVHCYRPLPADSFTLFPNLPFELRQKIWLFAAASPRIVFMVNSADTQEKTTSFFTASPIDWSKGQWQAKYKAPALLSACHQSRMATIKFYQPAFGDQLGRPIYFAPSADVLTFSCGFSVEVFFEQDWKKTENRRDQRLVRHHAVLTEHDETVSMERWARDCQTHRAKIAFENLERMTFINVDYKGVGRKSLEDVINPAGILSKALEKSMGREEDIETGLKISSIAYKDCISI